MADEINAIWKRIDDHSGQLKDLTVQQTLHKALIDQHAEEFRKMNTTIAQQNTRIIEKIGAVGTDVTVVLDDYKKRQGAKEQRELASVDFKMAMAIIGLLCTVIGTIYLLQ